jgi:hypothetical protein
MRTTAKDGAVLLALALVAAAAYAGVRPTNFGGYDEWLVVSLTARGILDMPHANRPLDLLWPWPGALLLPGTLVGYLAVHVAYLLLSAQLVFVLVRRLGASLGARTAYLAAVLGLVWAPLDYMRLDAPLIARYSGATLAALVSVLLFVESWSRRRPALLGLAVVCAAVTGRGCEAALPLLFGAPALLFGKGRPPARPAALWAGAWTAGVLVATAALVAPMLSGGRALYQTEALRLDAHPWRVAVRLGRQFALHLGPLVTTPPHELLVPAVPAALAAFALGWWLTRPAHAGDGYRAGDAQPQPRLLRLALAGASAAALGYAAFALTPAIAGAARTQVLSAPGIGLLLAAAIVAVSLRLPSRARTPAAAALAGAVVALGTARVAALQRQWDAASAYPAQARLLAGLSRAAPGLRPHTLVLLLDEDRAFEATFTFRHALAFAYTPEVAGWVWGGHDLLYPATLAADGVRWEPWPEIRRSWDEAPARFGYDELVVVRHRAGAVEVLDQWPGGVLPSLPPGAAYAPRGRIVSGTPPPLLARPRP